MILLKKHTHKTTTPSPFSLSLHQKNHRFFFQTSMTLQTFSHFIPNIADRVYAKDSVSHKIEQLLPPQMLT